MSLTATSTLQDGIDGRHRARVAVVVGEHEHGLREFVGDFVSSPRWLHRPARQGEERLGQCCGLEFASHEQREAHATFFTSSFLT